MRVGDTQNLVAVAHFQQLLARIWSGEGIDREPIRLLRELRPGDRAADAAMRHGRLRLAAKLT